MRRRDVRSAVDRYIRACAFEQVVDHAAIETAMSAWCREIGAPTDTRITFVSSDVEALRAAWATRLGWATEDGAETAARAAGGGDAILTRLVRAAWRRSGIRGVGTARHISVARAASAVRDAKGFRAATIAGAAKDVRSARDATATGAARDALAARASRVARAIKEDAKAANRAGDKDTYMKKMHRSAVAARVSRGAQDLSELAATVVGALARGDRRTARIWLPLLSAFEAGAFVFWEAKDEIFVAVIPRVVRLDEAHRLHCETGPAFVWLSDIVESYWHGVRVPDDWLERRGTLTVADIFREQNAEVRRAGCEIIGWDRVLTGIDARLIDDDGDPQIGTLYEGQIPGASSCGFLKVQCGTGRVFVEPVPAGLRTAIAAQAWREDIPMETWTKPEVRG